MEENKTVVDGFNNKIDSIEALNEVTLKDTIDLMTSDDYRLRFVAEYMQTKIRFVNLRKMLIKLEADTLEFTPKCSTITLNNQKSFMEQYLKILEVRAEVEGIRLPKNV